MDVPNPAGRLKPEMYATTEIDLGGSASGVFVPQGATQEVRGQTVLATVVIGGLITSTVLVLPLVYPWFSKGDVAVPRPGTT